MTVTLVTPGQFEVLIGLVDPPTEDVTCDVASFDLQANPNTITVPASFCADGYDDVGSVSRALVLNVLCDWSDPDGLAWFLYDNSGAEGYVKVVKAPAATGKPGWTAHVRFVMPNVTLATGQAAVVDVTLPVFDVVPIKPTIVLAQSAPTPAAAGAK